MDYPSNLPAFSREGLLGLLQGLDRFQILPTDELRGVRQGLLSNDPRGTATNLGLLALGMTPLGKAGKVARNNIDIAKSTSRSSGAIGKDAVTPRYVSETSGANDTILNFGAGKHDIHTTMLRERGLNVKAHDFHNPNPEALLNKYDTVFGSNVINVQNTNKMLQNTLDEMTESVAPNGRLVVNLPVAPRYKAWAGNVKDTAKLKKHLTDRFESVSIVNGNNQRPIFEARVPRKATE